MHFIIDKEKKEYVSWFIRGHFIIEKKNGERSCIIHLQGF